jgi:hypothetical protein
MSLKKSAHVSCAVRQEFTHAYHYDSLLPRTSNMEHLQDIASMLDVRVLSSLTEQ